MFRTIPFDDHETESHVNVELNENDEQKHRAESEVRQFDDQKHRAESVVLQFDGQKHRAESEPKHRDLREPSRLQTLRRQADPKSRLCTGQVSVQQHGLTTTFWK